jgi:hypothetical protein
MMSIKQLIMVLLISALFVSCYLTEPENDILPEEVFRFEKMKIEYIKTGGWITPRVLDITGNDGSAFAYILGSTHDYPYKSGLLMLNEEQKKEIASLFRFFRSYDRHYTPDKFYTDQNYKNIILHYEGRTDTVSVYHLPHATVPRSFRNVVEYLDALQTEIIETYGKTHTELPVFYRNSFEVPDDTAGWYGYAAIEIVEQASRWGSRYSLRVSGGCPVPHAKFDFEPASHDRQFILQGWGKAEEGTGGVTLSSRVSSTARSIGFSVNRKQWTFYQSVDTLSVAAGDTMSIQVSAGGIVPATILVDLIAIREIE